MEDRIYQLIEMLIEKTKRGKTIWTKDGTSNIFKISLGNSIIQTDNWVDPFGGDYIDFQIFNSKGEAIITHKYQLQGEEDDSLMIIKHLYDAILYQYLDVDNTLNSIFDELE